MYYTRYFIFLFLQLLVLSLISQNSYNISFEAEGMQSDTFYLAHYYTDKFLIVDTSYHAVDQAHFKGDEKLKHGIYLLANDKKEKVAEFLVDDKQSFQIRLFQDGRFPKIKNSKANILFYEHLEITNQVVQQIDSIRQAISNGKIDAFKGQAEIKVLADSLKAYRSQKINDEPLSLFSMILKAMEEPQIPVNLQQNKEAAFQFYKNHYWDLFDLSDERLLNTPFLAHKLENYFNQIIPPIADSVIREIDNLVVNAADNQDAINFMMWHFFSEYQVPKYMGLDKVFIHIVDNYFLQGRVSNINSSLMEQIIDRADKIRPTLIGNLAPDMWLIDTTDNYRSFREIKHEFVVLFFWDQTCSHCKKEMEVLDKIYNSKKYDLEIFSINTTNDMEGWRYFLNEKPYPWIHVNGTKSMTSDFHDLYDIYSIPVIYLLDEDKRIIAKRFAANHLEDIILNLKKGTVH